ncbi:STAS/SEC14 domain-containing protein [Micromonospora sp. DT227]|uniref:STAS/SEC14 domain-containing protein n=1 Tax=Micromonospora sp. DT227 TaxID=3393433 RepID=UPI003CEE0947
MPTADGNLTAAEVAQLYALVDTLSNIREQLTILAVSGALAPLRGFTGWYDPTAVDLAMLQVLRVVQPAQRRMAEVTDAYLARAMTTMTGRAHRPVGAVDVTKLRRALTTELAEVLDRPPVELVPDGDLPLDRVFRDPDRPTRGQGDQEPAGDGPARPAGDRTVNTGMVRPGDPLSPARQLADRRPAGQTPAPAPTLRAVDPLVAYSRVAAQYRFRVSEGDSEDVARRRALQRAQAMAQTDIALAQRAQEHEVLVQFDPNEVIGWRRILRPELSESGPCGLCIVAADRRYHLAELKPLHDNCKCAVLPILRMSDPGLKLNADDLGRLYAAAAGGDGRSTAGRRLNRVRAMITEDGELGPILVNGPKNPRGKGRRGPRAAAAATRRQAYEPFTPDDLPSLEMGLEDMIDRFQAGARHYGPLVEYRRKLIAELRAEAAAGR